MQTRIISENDGDAGGSHPAPQVDYLWYRGTHLFLPFNIVEPRDVGENERKHSKIYVKVLSFVSTESKGSTMSDDRQRICILALILHVFKKLFPAETVLVRV